MGVIMNRSIIQYLNESSFGNKKHKKTAIEMHSDGNLVAYYLDDDNNEMKKARQIGKVPEDLFNKYKSGKLNDDELEKHTAEYVKNKLLDKSKIPVDFSWHDSNNRYKLR